MGDLKHVSDILPAIAERKSLVPARRAGNPSPAFEQRINELLAIEIEDAQEAGALGFMARALVQATMPHKAPKEMRFVRTNGAFRLEMVALQSDIGLPYGTIPRLMMSWISTEAVRTKSPVLVLGDSLSAFMNELGMVPTGGRWGSITRLRKQAMRLFTTAVSCMFQSGDPQARARSARNILIADAYDEYWWKPRDPEQRQLFESTVTLSSRFFEEIVRSPVPIDLRTLKALAKSPLAIDIYVWLTYRMSYLRRETPIPWPALEMQFGSEYGRTRDFKAAFLQHLKSVQKMYPAAKIAASDDGLVLRPSATHVRRVIPGV